MADREKVISDMEWMLNDIVDNGHYQIDYYADVVRSALALLKGKKPVKPIRINTNYEQSYTCGKCGRAVKWND